MLFSAHLPIFKPFHRVCPEQYHFVYIVQAQSQRLEARRHANLGEGKIATKLANKKLSNASIALKRGGHTYSRPFHLSNL